jgi:ribosomal-protein-alanine N-acetyltransferase
VRLRPALPEDAAALAGVHAGSFDAPWSPEDLRQLIGGPGALAVLAEDAQGPVGFILARAVAGEAEILTVAVEPQRRRCGLGSVLVEAAAGAARAAGAESLFLEVATDNAAGLRLYERAGFERAGFRARYYKREGAPPADAFVLRRDLTP